MKNLMPLLKPESFINTKTGDIKPLKYMTGQPRNYRLNCSSAVLNIEGKTVLTNPNQEFQVIPLAIRTFEGDLFNQGKKKWCEMYFINEAGHVCNFMFHQYSLDNFREQFRELYYDDTNPCDVIWTIGFDSKQTKEGAKYHLATFEYKLLSKKQAEAMQTLRNEIKQSNIYIYQARFEEHLSMFSAHASSPLEPSEEDKKLEAKRQTQLLDKEFALPKLETNSVG